MDVRKKRSIMLSGNRSSFCYVKLNLVPEIEFYENWDENYFDKYKNTFKPHPT